MHRIGTTELAHRSGDGIEVSLRWNRLTDEVVVEVGDLRTGDSFAFLPPRDAALDAFHHPFAYASQDARPASFDEVARLAA